MSNDAPEEVIMSDIAVTEVIISDFAATEPLTSTSISHTSWLTCGNELPIPKTRDFKACNNVGTMPCLTCGLIKYCSELCLKEHWPVHKEICVADCCSKSWGPSIRKLAMYGDTARESNLWGTMPALDALNLKDNEGVGYDEDLNLLFAASGNLRNALRTINTLPLKYKRRCEIVLNDRDPEVVIRNTIMLLILGMFPSQDGAVKSVVHLWYSAALPGDLWKQISDTVGRSVEEFYSTVKQKKGSTQVSNSWAFGSGTVRVTLARKQWKRMLEILQPQKLLDPIKLFSARKDKLFNEEAKLMHDMRLFRTPIELRRQEVRFQKTGILLPFSEPVGSYDTPNPTLFGETSEWEMNPGESPLDGWWLPSLIASCEDFGVPPNDTYGSLNCLLTYALEAFSERITNLKLGFHLYCVDALQLDGVLGNHRSVHVNGLSFDRIDASNLADDAFLGFEKTICAFGRRLRPKTTQTMHATLIMLHGDAAKEPEVAAVVNLCAFDLAFKVLTASGRILKKEELLMELIKVTRPFFADHKKHWDKYMEEQRFRHWATVAGVQMKLINKIALPWPFKLLTSLTPEELKRQVGMLLATSLHSGERYVEWSRKW